MFDIVVIDASSMLPLPVVAYVSGLAKEKVTVTGDFLKTSSNCFCNKRSFSYEMDWQ